MASPYGRCKRCTQQVRHMLTAWREQFRSCCAGGRLAAADWQRLCAQLDQAAISLAEAMDHIRTDALHVLEQTIAGARAAGQLGEQEEMMIRRLLPELEGFALHIADETARLAAVREIRRGRLPEIRPSTALAADEVCHLETRALHYHSGPAADGPIPGRLIITSRRVLFLGTTDAVEIPLTRVLRIQRQLTGVYLEVARQHYTGYYTVDDALLVSEMINGAVHAADRRIAVGALRDSATIPG